MLSLIIYDILIYTVYTQILYGGLDFLRKIQGSVVCFSSFCHVFDKGSGSSNGMDFAYIKKV